MAGHAVESELLFDQGGQAIVFSSGSFWFIVYACILDISPNKSSTSVYMACTSTFCTHYTQTAE